MKTRVGQRNGISVEIVPETEFEKNFMTDFLNEAKMGLVASRTDVPEMGSNCGITVYAQSRLTWEDKNKVASLEASADFMAKRLYELDQCPTNNCQHGDDSGKRPPIEVCVKCWKECIRAKGE